MTDAYLPVFDIPFPLRSSPHVSHAREINLERLRSHGMLATDEARAWYLNWDMAQLAGYGYPYADCDSLALGVDQMAFFFLFDDQFDGPLGRRPERVAAVCGKLIDVLFTPPQQRPRGASPLVSFFSSFWERSVRGMAPSWCARAAHNWEYYLATYVGEATDRVGGAVPAMEHFLQVRRGIAGDLQSDGLRRTDRRVPRSARRVPHAAAAHDAAGRHRRPDALQRRALRRQGGASR